MDISEIMRDWAIALNGEGTKAASVACLRAAHEIDRLRAEVAFLNARLAATGDPAAIAANDRALRAERLANLGRAIAGGRARWGRLTVVEYNDHTGNARVRDDSEKGDGVVRTYRLALESIMVAV